MNWSRLIFGAIQSLASKQPQATSQQKRYTSQHQTEHHEKAVDITVFNRFKPMQKILVGLKHQVDGDTTVLRYRGNEYRARFLMLDTPETVKEHTKVMPIGHVASNYTKDRLEHAHRLEIAFDRGPRVDEYGRLLVYVYVDGQDLIEELLAHGYGIVRYVNPPNDTNAHKYQQVQEKARRKKRGVWQIPNYVILKHGRDYRFNESFE